MGTKADRRRRGTPAAAVLTVVVVLGLTLLGGWAGTQRDQLHAATTTLLVNPLEGNPFSPDARDGLVNLETEARLVTSDAVAQAVQHHLGLASPKLAVTGVKVQVPSNTQLLRITVERRDLAAATELADALATTFLAQRKQRTVSTVDSRRAHVRAELKSMQGELDALTTRRSASGLATPAAVLLDQQIAGLVAQMAQVQAEQTTLGYISDDPGQVVTPAAEEPAGPFSAPVLGAAAGGILGVALALGLRVLRTRRRDLVGSAIDLVAAGYPVLAEADQVDLVRAEVLVNSPQRPVVVLVADAGDSVLGADTAREVAASMGRAQVRTVLVTVASEALDEQDGPGLAEVCTGSTPLGKALVDIDDFTRVLRPGGTRVENDAGDLVASPPFSAVVKELREHGEVVLVAGVSLPGAAGRVVLGQVDAVVVQATRGRTSRQDLAAAVQVAEEGSARFLGVVHAGTEP